MRLCPMVFQLRARGRPGVQYRSVFLPLLLRVDLREVKRHFPAVRGAQRRVTGR